MLPCSNTDKGGIADCQTCSKTEEPVTQSDPALCPLLTRGAPEQRKPHSLLTDINWTPGVSSDSPETDGRPPGSPPKATEGSPAHPRRSANRDTRAAGTAPATVQVRVQRPSGTPGEQPDECDHHHPPAEQRATHRGTARAPDSDDNCTT